MGRHYRSSPRANSQAFAANQGEFVTRLFREWCGIDSWLSTVHGIRTAIQRDALLPVECLATRDAGTIEAASRTNRRGTVDPFSTPPAIAALVAIRQIV